MTNTETVKEENKLHQQYAWALPLLASERSNEISSVSGLLLRTLLFYLKVVPLYKEETGGLRGRRWSKKASKWQTRVSPISFGSFPTPLDRKEVKPGDSVASDKCRGSTGLKTGLQEGLSPKPPHRGVRYSARSFMEALSVEDTDSKE